MDNHTKSLRHTLRAAKMVTMVPVLRRMSPRTLKRTCSSEHSQSSSHKLDTSSASKKLTFNTDSLLSNSQISPLSCPPVGVGVKRKRRQPPKIRTAKIKVDVPFPDAGTQIGATRIPPSSCPPVGGFVKRKRGRPPGNRQKRMSPKSDSSQVDSKAKFTEAMQFKICLDRTSLNTISLPRKKVTQTTQIHVLSSDQATKPAIAPEISPPQLETARSRNSREIVSRARQDPIQCSTATNVTQSTSQQPARDEFDGTINPLAIAAPETSPMRFKTTSCDSQRLHDLSINEIETGCDETDSLGSHIDYPPPSTPQQKEVRRLARLRQLEEMRKREAVFAREERFRKRKGDLQVSPPKNSKKILWKDDLVEVFVYSPATDKDINFMEIDPG